VKGWDVARVVERDRRTVSWTEKVPVREGAVTLPLTDAECAALEKKERDRELEWAWVYMRAAAATGGGTDETVARALALIDEEPKS
jgi:hypothetical protein